MAIKTNYLSPADRRRMHVNPITLVILLFTLILGGLFTTIIWNEPLTGVGVAIALSLIVIFLAERDEEGTVILLVWILRLLIGFGLFRLLLKTGGTPDWVKYDREGANYAFQITTARELPVFTFGGGTENVSVFVGYIYAVIGRTMVGIWILQGFMGLLASWLYFKSARLIAPQIKWIRYTLLFYPSFIFWTTLMGKDPFVSLGIALGVYGIISICIEGKIASRIIMMATGVYLCALFRPHLVLIQTPALLAGLLFLFLQKQNPAQRRRIPKPAFRLVVILGIIAGIAVWPALMNIGMRKIGLEKFELEEVVERAGEYRESNPAYSGGSGTGLQGYESFTDFIRKLPESFAVLFFRPLLFEAHNLAAFLSALETAIFVAFFIWFLVKMFRYRRKTSSVLRLSVPISRFLIVWIILWALMFLNYTANLGTMVRHRTQIIPAFVLLGAIYLGAMDKSKKVEMVTPEKEKKINK